VDECPLSLWVFRDAGIETKVSSFLLAGSEVAVLESHCHHLVGGISQHPNILTAEA
jgi:hypothetical protein